MDNDNLLMVLAVGSVLLSASIFLIAFSYVEFKIIGLVSSGMAITVFWIILLSILFKKPIKTRGD